MVHRFVAPWHVGSSRIRNLIWSPALAGGFFTTEPPGKLQKEAWQNEICVDVLNIDVKVKAGIIVG